jgi:predicted transcriptional regulator
MTHGQLKTIFDTLPVTVKGFALYADIPHMTLHSLLNGSRGKRGISPQIAAKIKNALSRMANDALSLADENK